MTHVSFGVYFQTAHLPTHHSYIDVLVGEVTKLDTPTLHAQLNGDVSVVYSMRSQVNEVVWLH